MTLVPLSSDVAKAYRNIRESGVYFNGNDICNVKRRADIAVAQSRVVWLRPKPGLDLLVGLSSCGWREPIF